MELTLVRHYLPTGTNGYLFDGDQLICFTIELPWRDNEPHVSCILEGRFRFIKRYSKKYGWHLALENVKGRSLILFHPANNAQTELKGCIAPVTMLSGIGTGLFSIKANETLKKLVFTVLSNDEPVYLSIQNLLSYEHDRTHISANT